MWPWKVVTSLPRIGMIPSGQASTSRWWLIVLWSVIARKSSPRSTAPRTRSSTVTSPSLWTVCEWRSPRYQRAPPAGVRPGAWDDGWPTAAAIGVPSRADTSRCHVQVTGLGAIVRIRPVSTLRTHGPAGIGPARQPGVALDSPIDGPAVVVRAAAPRRGTRRDPKRLQRRGVRQVL